MNHYRFGNLRRISKSRARKLWGKVDIHLCPAKLRPGPPWSPDITIFAEDICKGLSSEYEHVRRQCSFEAAVANFEYYNCTSETGLYTAFYLGEKT